MASRDEEDVIIDGEADDEASASNQRQPVDAIESADGLVGEDCRPDCEEQRGDDGEHQTEGDEERAEGYAADQKDSDDRRASQDPDGLAHHT